MSDNNHLSGPREAAEYTAAEFTETMATEATPPESSGDEGRPQPRATPITAYSSTSYGDEDWSTPVENYPADSTSDRETNTSGWETNTADWETVDVAANDSMAAEYSEPSLPATSEELATIPELAPLADGGPPDIAPPTAITAAPAPNQPPGSDDVSDTEQDLFSHLAELRGRILYSLAAVAIAMCFTWNFGTHIQKLVEAPIKTAYQRTGVRGDLTVINPTDGFMFYFQMSLISGLILAMPFVLFQFWRFVEPALTQRERRYSLLLVPFSVTLFFMGAILGYFVSPLFFQFFLAFIPPGALANLSYIESVVLLEKMLLVFGVCFQVPVVTIFFNKIGLVSRNILIEYWRHAVIVIFVVVAVLTPTWDPLTLLACAIPPCLLYGLSIWLVKWL